MISKAKVIRIIDENVVEVEVTRQSACGDNCASCSGCEKPTYKAVSKAYNYKNAQVGDIVCVKGNASYVLKGAAYIYMLPLILFFVGYFILGYVTTNEGVKSGMGIFGFILGIYFAGLYNKKIQAQNKINLEIL